MSKILIIEPDSVLAQIYQEALEHVGHKATIATGAQEAITLADKATPDLVVLELQIASHNGIEFLYEFRSYPEWQSVPVVVHSVVPPAEVDDNEVLWQQIGISDYLYKPHTTLDQLIRAVRKNLSVNPAKK